MRKNPETVKRHILRKVALYYNLEYKQRRKNKFIPGVTPVHYAGRVYDSGELKNLVDSALDFWLTAGKYSRKLEDEFRRFFKAVNFYLVNSGSSANLLMVSALRSGQVRNALKPGDEVITPAVTFPTSIAPIIQNQLIPVLIDCELGTYNIKLDYLDRALTPRTRAIFVPHTLGNPCNMDRITAFAEKKNLILLEDACDALGASYKKKKVGTFGAMSSLSFFPAHHITTGEGGGVAINDKKYEKVVRSLRDWGRDCWCEAGQNNSCGERFGAKFGRLPRGYDHKYVYSNIGFNFRITDMQSAVGLAQFKKLGRFIKERRRNFHYFYQRLKSLEDKLILPRWEAGSEPSWFGFPITVKNQSDADGLIKYLEKARIETRRIFSGNIIRQPGFIGAPCRIPYKLINSDKIMKRSFFFGVYPGLTQESREFIVASFYGFFKKEYKNKTL